MGLRLASRAMKNRGVAGMVIEGGCRDIDDITEVGLPTYTRHVTATTGRTRIKIVSTNFPVDIGNVRVFPGDVVVADDDGVVILALVGVRVAHLNHLRRMLRRFAKPFIFRA